MAPMKNHLFIVCLLTVFNFNSFAQRNSFKIQALAMVVQGEASGGSLLSDDIALGIGIGFDAPIYKSKIEFISKLEYFRLKLDYIGKSSPQNINVMVGVNMQVSAGVGLNIYLNKSTDLVSLYQPFRPYVSFLAGVLLQDNSLVFSDNFTFPNVQGTFILPFGELSAGLKIRVNPTWAVNFNAAARTTLSDEIDGLIGNTDIPDIMGLVRFGISYNIR
jgi:hypothetical protein